MTGPSQVFWVVFVPCRPDFHTTMTPEEQALIVGHLEHLAACQERGELRFAGRAADASHGVAIFEVEDEKKLRALLDGNPAVKAGALSPSVKPYLGPRTWP